jgi:peptide/nickel transport system substrate-binding protein
MEGSNYWPRVSARRLSRRRLLAVGGAAALGGAAAIVVGCGGGGSGDGQPRRGGNVTIGRSTNVLGIDPHIDLTGLTVDRLVYSYLYSWDAVDQELVLNDLAAEFENPDGLTFIFTLRKGVMTHPGGYPGAGEEMTAEDCRQSFYRRGTSITATDKRLAFRIAGSTDPAMLLPALEAPDRYTFRFKMAEPFVPALREMARDTWAVVPAKVIDAFGLGLSQVAHGSGPFILEEFRGTERVVLRRHPNYFIDRCPLADSITLQIITDPDALRGALESGVIEVTDEPVSKEWIDEVGDDPDYTVGREVARSYHAVHLNSRPPYNDIRVRQAINLGLDRDDYILSLLSGEGQYNGAVPWALRDWALPQAELRSSFEYDVVRAKALLSEAGYDGGFGETLGPRGVADRSAFSMDAMLIEDNMEDLTIALRPAEFPISGPPPTLVPFNKHDFELTQIGPIDEPDQALIAYRSNLAFGGESPAWFANAELDALVEAQSREFDPERRLEIVHEAQRLIMRDHLPPLPLPSGFEYRVRRSKVHVSQDQEVSSGDVSNLPYGCDIWTEKT